MLPKILFSLVLSNILQRSIEDTVILATLVYLEERPTSVGPESAIYYIRRAVWGVLDTDGACIVSRSPWGLTKSMKVIVDVCRSIILSMSAKKTHIIFIPPPRTPRMMKGVNSVGQTYKHM